MRYRVLPYRQSSASATRLAEALDGRVLRLQDSTFHPRRDDVVINWGNTEGTRVFPRQDLGFRRNHVLLNEPSLIQQASNKLSFFQLMAENNSDIIPPFYTNQGDIPDDAFPIVCRTVLAGHSGDGIVIAASRGELVPARLYVKYVKKQDEYRIHVGRNEDDTSIISIQRKARRADYENPNFQIRNHANGFNFVRNEVHSPASVVEAARRALLATGLDFGAVDVIYNARQERPYVLEINTAPGLEGQTITDYSTFFRSIV